MVGFNINADHINIYYCGSQQVFIHVLVVDRNTTSLEKLLPKKFLILYIDS